MTKRLSSRSIGIIFIAAITLAAGTCVPVVAQPTPPVTTPPVPAPQPAPKAQPPTAPAPAAKPSKPEDTRPAEQILGESLARQLTQLALVDLRVLDAPRAEDYKVAAALLAAASARLPDDQDILRLAIDAATQAGDNPSMLRLNRRLVDLDPLDTRAQLTLIASRISSEQTVEKRLEMYERFLGERGQAIDEAVRSRLALDAALLLRERGDGEGFVRKLALATSLDPSNKEAAALAYTFYVSRVQDGVGEFEMLVNLLKADPLDQRTHLAMAKHLAEYGAHRGALRFFRNYSTIRERTFQPLDASLYAQQYAQQWIVDGPEVVFKDLWEKIDKPRRKLRQERADAEAAGRNLDRFPKPESMRLAFELSQLTAGAAMACDKPEQADSMLQDMLTTLADIRTEIDQPSMRHSGLSEPELKEELSLWRRETTFTCLCLNRKLADVEAFVEPIRQDPATPARALQLLDLWSGLRKGDASVKEGFVALAGEDPYAALGLGELAMAAGDRKEAVKQFITAYTMTPGTLAGAWARSRALAAGAGSVPQPETGRTLDAQASGVPSWMDDMIERPSSYQSVSATPTTTRFDPLAPVTLKMSVRNMSQIPLALGAEAPISSRFLLVPRLWKGTEHLLEPASPEVIKLDRRLRLKRSEQLEATVWVDPGMSGWLLSFYATDPLRESWRVLQGFIVGEGRVAGPGAFSLTVETPEVFRAGVPDAGISQEQLVEAIANAQTGELLSTLAVARARMMQSNPNGKLRMEESQAISAALLDRYRKSDATVRALMLTALPNSRLALGMKPFDRALRDEADSDPLVILVRLVTRADEPEDPAFALAAASKDPQLPELATVLRERLKASNRSFSRLLEPKRPGTLTTPPK